MSEIKPALTPEEWKTGVYEPGEFFVEVCAVDAALLLGDPAGNPPGAAYVPEEHRHALAALCLQDQPFGFTHADVALLGAIADQSDAVDIPEARDGDAIRNLAARIAALLPPREGR